MGLPGVAGRAVSRPGCCTPRVKPSFEVQKSEGDRAFEPGFPPEGNWRALRLRRRACRRAATLQPQQRLKGPRSGKVAQSGTWRRGQSAPRTRRTRGRLSPPEPQAACSRRPRWRGGPNPGQRQPVVPRSSWFGEDPYLPQTRGPHPAATHTAPHLKNDPGSQKSWYWGEMKCTTHSSK